VLRLAIVNFPKAVAVEAEQDCAWIAQNDGRVSRDEELGMPRCGEVVIPVPAFGIEAATLGECFEQRGLSVRKTKVCG
jgi:hypothetical protein